MAGYKANKKPSQQHRVRMWQGQPVTPTRYWGAGHKGTMCASIDGELVRDAQGRVLPLRSI